MKRVIPFLLLAACGPNKPGTEPFHPEGSGSGGDDRAETTADTTATPSDQLDDTAQAIVDAHNAVRAKHCAPALSWSDELAQAAQGWVDHLAQTSCELEHSDLQYGENLAMGATGDFTGESAVQMWYDENQSSDYKTGGFSMDTGHFTQVVWASTQHVGCAVASCNGWDIWACEYDPPGNYDGEYQDQVKPPC